MRLKSKTVQKSTSQTQWKATCRILLPFKSTCKGAPTYYRHQLVPRPRTHLHPRLSFHMAECFGIQLFRRRQVEQVSIWGDEEIVEMVGGWKLEGKFGISKPEVGRREAGQFLEQISWSEIGINSWYQTHCQRGATETQ